MESREVTSVYFLTRITLQLHRDGVEPGSHAEFKAHTEHLSSQISQFPHFSGTSNRLAAQLTEYEVKIVSFVLYYDALIKAVLFGALSPNSLGGAWMTA